MAIRGSYHCGAVQFEAPEPVRMAPDFDRSEVKVREVDGTSF